MNSVGFIFIVLSLCGVILAQVDQTSSGAGTECGFNAACKSVHTSHSIINNDVICCLNGQLPSVNIINNKIFCTCDPANTMTPQQLHEMLNNTMNAVNLQMQHVVQNLHQSLDGLGEKISAAVQNALG